MRRAVWHQAAAWFGVSAYAAVIFYFSSRPSIPVPMWFPGQDKLYHFVEYHVLGILLAHAVVANGHKKRFWIALVLASVYGISDEIHQSFVPGRDASVFDWMADTVGAWAGAYLYLRSEGLLRLRGR